MNVNKRDAMSREILHQQDASESGGNSVEPRLMKLSQLLTNYSYGNNVRNPEDSASTSEEISKAKSEGRTGYFNPIEDD